MTGEETGGVEIDGEETRVDFEFWDESKMMWGELLFICSKI
jgi:hypothetical protein